MRAYIADCRKGGHTVALISTRGALHDAHIGMIQRAKDLYDIVVVSSFLNPMSFESYADYERYPREMDNDIKICEKYDVDVLFTPTFEEMFGIPEIKINSLKYKSLTLVSSPFDYADKLLGAGKQGYFEGFATTTLKLLNIVTPNVLFWGQKDIQQVYILKKMIQDFNIPVKLRVLPIVREINGIPISSENVFMTDEEKNLAASVSKFLMKMSNDFKSGERDITNLKFGAESFLDKSCKLDFLEFLHFDDFEREKEIAAEGTIIAVGSKIGKFRIIDNIILS